MYKDYIKIIEGELFNGIGRAADMCWVHFGETIQVNDYKGDIVEKGTYALHLQCPWRIIKKEEQQIISLGSYDIYEPKSTMEWSEDFDWDVQGMNLFDEKLSAIKIYEKVIHIKSVKINTLNDLKIIFSNECILETFINSSTDNECWRFFKCNSHENHLIATGRSLGL